MIRLTIKVKSENKRHSLDEYLPDDYVVSKSNEHLKHLVEKVIADSNFSEIEEVKLIARFEW